MPQGMPLHELFDYDPPGNHTFWLGGTVAPFLPAYETKVLEDLGDYELVQDNAGRHVLYFKGRRDGFMPEYVAHPVKDMKTWEENVKWLHPYLRPWCARGGILRKLPVLSEVLRRAGRIAG